MKAPNSIVQAIKRVLFLAFVSIVLYASQPTGLMAQTVVGTITRAGLKPNCLAVYETGNKLCVYDASVHSILVYDCSNDSLLAVFSIPSPVWDYDVGMRVNESTGRLYFLDGISASGGYAKIFIYDLTSNTAIDTVSLGNHALGQSFINVEIDTSIGHFYALFSTDLFSLDLTSHTCTRIDLNVLGSGLRSSLAVNPITHEVFCSNRTVDRNYLDLIDGTSLSASLLPACSGWDVVTNPLENKIYVTTSTWNGYWVHDRDNGYSIITPCINDAGSLFFNSKSNRVYTDAEVNREVTVIDGASDSCYQLELNGSALQVGFRYATNNVYFVGDNFVKIFRETSGDVDLIPIANPNPSHGLIQAIAVNQTTGRVFVVNDADSLHCITVIQDSARAPHIAVYPDTIVTGNSDTLYCDDGKPSAYETHAWGLRMAIRMSPLAPCKITAIQMYCPPGSQRYKVGIYDWSESSPGNKLIETDTAFSYREGWNTTDITLQNVNVTGDFIASFNSIDSFAKLGYDMIDNGRAWYFNGGSWSPQAKSYFIRAIVQYETGSTDTIATMLVENVGYLKLMINDITSNQNWIREIAPRAFSVEPHQSTLVTIKASPEGLSSGTYYGSLLINCNDPDKNLCLVPLKFVVKPMVGIQENESSVIPTDYALWPNYPNPFNPVTSIKYQIPKTSYVSLKIFDILGREIATLVDGIEEAGYKSVEFDGHGLASGIYLCRLQAGRYTSVKKMLLLR